MALARRALSGIDSSVEIVRDACCAMMVTTLEAMEIARSGIFSRMIRENFGCWILDVGLVRSEESSSIVDPKSKISNRFSGHQSSNSSTHGTVTSIGFDINPSAKNASASP